MYLILTFAGLTIILFVCALIQDKFNKWYRGDAFRLWGYILLFITAVMIILIPICRYYSAGRIVEYKTRQATIEQQRKSNISELERVELTKEILGDNAWLSGCKYDVSNKWFDIYYDKEVLNLQPIE
ncbi:hypothetical protein [Clostridium beijerinckii]|uniref:hypothetical protein n=1 Tax=Clostridium beijerinckii TaxID=1520 RepID=UPI001360E47E|nr:hypothetical protein [Clostridium beijerinckii]MZK53474.1 hypothetical protein [Clostridium beijerinckii]MZK61612.1 hypothetical protein [Clostridium beijerinckii]MZK71837.1 hypothetical protein [Clostridium beijerinckii]MZK77241.1 hypothetical protein [Clostridium beijerinckii]MZK86320.1 hypothetical protein [Clostridium beijerinckii]